MFQVTFRGQGSGDRSKTLGRTRVNSESAGEALQVALKVFGAQSKKSQDAVTRVDVRRISVTEKPLTW